MLPVYVCSMSQRSEPFKILQVTPGGWLLQEIPWESVGYLHNPTYNKQYFGMEHLQKRKDDDPARQTHGDGAAEPEESLAIEAQVPGGLGV